MLLTFAEELWEKLGGEYSIFNCSFPVCDESALVMDTKEMPLQVNGKLKGKFQVPSKATKEEIEQIAREQFPDIFSGEIKKIIVVPGRIVNIVV